MAAPSSISPDPEKIDPLTGRDSVSPDLSENPQAFKQHMQTNQLNSPEKQTAPSPMDIANMQKINPTAPPTMDSVKAQMDTASDSLGDIKSELHKKGLKLKASDKYLIRKKLTNANEHISAAAKHVGVDTQNFDAKLNRSKNPIARFLSMVSDGQNQMLQAANTIKNMNVNGQSINPSQLLLVQIKLQKAQQELNYTSTILGNATSMIKTIFSVQV
jgi:hypothetical protein